MPLPIDKARTDRSFRKCAGDVTGTSYHLQRFATEGGVAEFEIVRGAEGLCGILRFPSKALLSAALNTQKPVFHGMLGLAPPSGVTWSYDKFGDAIFSGLKAGAYRDASAKEWSVQEVLLDSIDEVRRAVGHDLGVEPVPTRAPTTSTPGLVERAVRRILR
jgi:hypothetical protein